jgi:hypothetical protein
MRNLLALTFDSPAFNCLKRPSEPRYNLGQGDFYMKRTLSCALAALMVTASVASAAQSVAVVQNVGGKVLVNKGKGFVPVTGSMQLGAGDTLMIGNKGSATLAYADCQIDLSKPAVVTISAKACDGVKKADGVFVTPTADMPVAAAPAFPLPALLLLGGAAVVTTAIIVGTKGKKSSVTVP